MTTRLLSIVLRVFVWLWNIFSLLFISSCLFSLLVLRICYTMLFLYSLHFICNCQGLGSVQKRKDIFHCVQQMSTKCQYTRNVCSFIKAEWRNDTCICLCPYLRNTRREIILSRNTFEQEEEHVYCHKLTRASIL